MAGESTDWHKTLAQVSGTLVRGEQRITTNELLTVHLGVPVTDQACRRLRRVMRDLGWRGPRRMRWGGQVTNGYWRHPTLGAPAIVETKPLAEASPSQENFAQELEGVTRLGLQKIDQILRLPTDPHNGNVLRAQISAASTAVNAQLKADETRLKKLQSEDLLKKLIQRMEEEREKLRPIRLARDELHKRKTGDKREPSQAGAQPTPNTRASDRS